MGTGDIPVPPWGQQHWHRVPRGRRSLGAPGPTCGVSLGGGLSPVGFFFWEGDTTHPPLPGVLGAMGSMLWGSRCGFGARPEILAPPRPRSGSFLGRPNPAMGPWACGVGGQAGLSPVKPGPPAATSALESPRPHFGQVPRCGGIGVPRTPHAGCPRGLGDFGVHLGGRGHLQDPAGSPAAPPRAG